jgi:hypothetical protein
VKIGKFIRYKKLGRVIFGKINSRIQTLTLGNYVFIIQLLKTQLLKTIFKSDRRSMLLTDDRAARRFIRDKHFWLDESKRSDWLNTHV